MPEQELGGLVPVALDDGAATVRLVKAGAAWFSEPFFDQTVRRLLRESAPVDVPIDDLHVRLATPQAAPAGLIFHTARCGSTLLTKLLRQARSTLVLGEPTVLGSAQRQSRAAGGDQLSTVVTDLVTAFAAFAEQRGDRLVVKLTSWQALDIAAYAQALPQVPLLFVHRPAEDVVASLLAQPPGWSPFGANRGELPWRSAELPPPDQPAAEWYARLWNMIVGAALQLPDERVRLLSHEALVRDPVGAVRAVTELFDLSGDWRARSLERELRYYAKSPDPTESFDPAGRHRRPALDPASLEAVRSMTRDLTAELEARTCPTGQT
ncbi:MAG: hypothetical protein HYX32_06300 [Actinobacteria bacterium]|nr:hypothetical protein [Actinomycetota bacterium]